MSYKQWLSPYNFPDNKIKKKFPLKRHDDVNTRKFKITLV